jgi:hypothetical protein
MTIGRDFRILAPDLGAGSLCLKAHGPAVGNSANRTTTRI